MEMAVATPMAADTRAAEDALRVVARWIAKKHGLRVVYHPDARPMAIHDLKTIYIPRCASNLDFEALIKLRTFIYHEAGHIVGTDSVAGLDAATNTVRQALEDVRMEAEVAEEHKGTGPVFDWATRYYNREQGKLFSTGQAGDVPLYEAACAMMYMIRGLSPAWTLSDTARRYADVAYPLFREVLTAESNHDCVDIAKRIIEKLKDVKKDMKKETPPPPPAPSGDEGEEGDADEDATPPPPAPNLTGDFPDEEEEEGDEGDEEFEETEKPEAGDGESEEDETGDEDESTGGSDADEGEGDETDDTSDGSDAGESDEPEEGDEDDSGSGGSDTSEDDDESSSETDESEDDEEGEDKTDKPTEGEDESAPAKLTPEPTDEELGDELNDEASDADRADILADDIEKAVEALDGMDATYTSYTDDDVCIIPSIREDYPRLYTVQRSQMNSAIAGMRSSLVQALRTLTRSRQKPYQEHGRLDSRRMVHVSKSLSKRVFFKKSKGEDLDTCVSIMIDESGSMSGSVMKTRLMAIALCEVLDALGIPFEVVGHSSKGDNKYSMREFTRTIPILYKWYKSFDEGFQAIKSRLIGTASIAQNVDGEVLKTIAASIASRSEKRKVILVLSDGAPCCGHNDHMLCQHLKYVVDKIRKSGIEVYGFGIGTTSPKRYYGEQGFVYLDSIANMGQKFFSEFATILTKGRVRM
jgi:hypothetical protein